MTRLGALLVTGLILAAALAPRPAAAIDNRAWTNYVRVVTSNDILATRDTVLVASGEAGLLRYLPATGKFESVTRAPNELASNALSVLAYDRTGRLWVGTRGKGVSRWSETRTHWDLVNAFDGVPSDTITALRADGDTMWIGTTRGIALWDGKQLAGAVPDVGTVSPFRSNLVTGIVVWGDSLFVGTADGIFVARLSQNLATWSEADAGMANLSVADMARTSGEMFASSGGTVYRWTGSGPWVHVPVPGDNTSLVAKMRDDFGMVLAASPNGLFAWNGSFWNGVAGGWGTGSGPDLNEFATASDGALYNVHNGTLYLRPAGQSSFTNTRPAGPEGNVIVGLAHERQSIWIGTDGQGVSRFDGTNWRLWPRAPKDTVPGPNQDTAFANPTFTYLMKTTRNGELWAWSWGKTGERVKLGLDPIRFQHLGWHNEVSGVIDTLDAHTTMWCAEQDSAGFLLVGGNSNVVPDMSPIGVDVYDTSGTRVVTWKTNNANLGSNFVRAIANDRYNTIWAGFASAGVAIAKLSDCDSDANTPGNDHRRCPQFSPITAITSSSLNDISAIATYGDSVWILTTGDLQRWNARGVSAGSRSVAKYEIPAGPPDRLGVHLLDLAADGTVYVGSAAGLRVFSPIQSAVDFTAANSPLLNDDIHNVLVEKGTGVVWIGTSGGLSRYDPHYTPPAAPTISALNVRAWPNPASMNAMGIDVRIAGNGTSYSGEILDINGRVVRRFAGTADRGTVWDGRDTDGDLVRAGVYFIHTRAGGHEATARIVVLR